MGAAAGIGAGIGVLGGYISGEAGVQAANYNSTVANANASMLEQQADRQYKAGLQAMGDYGRKVRQTEGAQRAGFAASGVDVSTGSAADIQNETEVIGAEDQRRIQTSAYLQALGMRTQAFNMREQAAFSSAAARNQANASIITGGLNGFMSAGGGKSLSLDGISKYIPAAGWFGGGGGKGSSAASSSSSFDESYGLR